MSYVETYVPRKRISRCIVPMPISISNPRLASLLPQFPPLPPRPRRRNPPPSTPLQKVVLVHSSKHENACKDEGFDDAEMT